MATRSADERALDRRVLLLVSATRKGGTVTPALQTLAGTRLCGAANQPQTASGTYRI